MPTLTFSQGKLVVVYYDSRLDHTRTFYTPHQTQDPCAPVGSCWAPNSEGRWYDEERRPVGERTGLDWTTAELDDSLMAQKRHTIDVRMAMAEASAAPVFTSAPLSRMPFGERGDELDLHPGGVAPGFSGPIAVVDLDASPKPALRKLQDLKVNPPNLPMFKSGTKPFFGDYIDVQGPAFVKKAGKWVFNNDLTPSPVFHAVWTSNEDVKAPPDGEVDDVHAPINVQGPSRVDPTQQTVACTPAAALYAASRNQNIYTARITEGLLVVSSPQNTKPLSSTQVRSFVIAAHNATSVKKTVKFTYTIPTGVTASFQALPGDSWPSCQS